MKEESEIIRKLKEEIGKGRTFEREKKDGTEYTGNWFRVKNDKVTGVRLCNIELNEIPSSIFELRCLEELNLGNNKLNNIPGKISQLKELKVLILRSNNLRDLPEEILELKNLERLDLRKNKFETTEIIDEFKKRKEESGKEIDIGLEGNPCYPKIKNKENIKTEVPKEKPDNTRLLPGSNKKIFISYSHKDKEYLERVRTHLKQLENEGIELDIWDDTKIKPGGSWVRQIENALRHARIAVLLISADFLASDFIKETELPSLLKAAADNDRVKIIPLILKPSRFLKNKHLSQFQAINDPKRPLIKLTEAEREEKLDDLVNEIEEYLSE